jgi:hypothetical protein
MKKLLILLALFSLLNFPLFAQSDAPAFEVFGGYSMLNDYDADATGQGFAAALEGNVTNIFGITGEFGFYDFDGGSLYSYMGGPRVSYRTETFRPFAHFLLGGVTLNPDEDVDNEHYFSMTFGGGVDINISDQFSIRPAQFDILTFRFTDDEVPDWINNIRYSAGVVLKF